MTKLFLMLCQVQHILLSNRSCVLDNQINVLESSNQTESGKNNMIPLIRHLQEIHIYNCKGNLISKIYLVAFNYHGPCAISVNNSISHS